MQSRKKVTKGKQIPANEITKLVGHYQPNSPIARLFEVLWEGKPADVGGIAESLAKGTTGSLRSLKHDRSSSGIWEFVRRPRAVRLMIRRTKNHATSKADSLSTATMESTQSNG